MQGCLLSGTEREKPVFYQSTPPEWVTRECPRLPEPELGADGKFHDSKKRLAWALDSVSLLLQCQVQHDAWRDFEDKRSKTSIDER